MEIDQVVKQEIANVFQQSAGEFDQVGVEFFGPAGRRLVVLARP